MAGRNPTAYRPHLVLLLCPPIPSATYTQPGPLMGRRKISIEPILAERNRSVTFLKRKNGLFKKAYELGVLCSVDVAVIVFEERPGHHQKLYTYCSGDIRELIARHVHYEGEREARNLADFAATNPAANKAKNAADAEDDDDDEEEEPAPPPKIAAKRSKKIDDDDADYSTPMAIPSPPISIRKLPKTTSTSIPTSNDRHSARTGKSNGSSAQPPSKKQRTASPARGPSSRGRSSSEEDGDLTLPLPFPNAGSYTFPPLMHRGSGGGGYGLPPPPPPFLGSMYDPPPMFRSQPQYDPGMYHQLLRAAALQHSQLQPPNPNPFALDWPVHSASGSGGGGGGAGGTHFPGTQVSSSHAPDIGPGSGSGNWLDFLSGMPPPPPPPLPSFSTHGGPAMATSWERGGGGGGAGGGSDIDIPDVDRGSNGRKKSKRGKRAKSRSRSESEDEESQTPDDKDG
ncbi:MADS-box transcription factor [Roridomyces roridus]|uniref:MADS-box transcription factor n=1 Tax=Roridomyces roridus TaxID=1738132 RepID=A0AAD7C217_9AGAR|nr:MADS-box transcription factor [Roridomyces roridus]